MIPKTIHYFWIGDENLKFSKTKKSWEKYAKDYEIKRWDESILDDIDNSFVKQAMAAKKYAFVSDYVRLYILEAYGGIYLDTDINIVSNIDQIINGAEFVIGSESEKVGLGTSFIASSAHNRIIKDLMHLYEDKQFNPDDLVPNSIEWSIFLKRKYDISFTQKIIEKNTIRVLPSTMVLNPSFHSVLIHIGEASWIDDDSEFRILSILFRRFLRTKLRVNATYGVYELAKKIRHHYEK